jgi:hypothetical protein
VWKKDCKYTSLVIHLKYKIGDKIMNILNSLEKSLADVYKGAPALPASAKKFLVEYMPWITLVIGLFTLLSVYWLWQWAHVANSLINYANTISAAYGGPTVSNRLDLVVWLGLIVLLVEAILYIAAFPALKARRKSGWDLLFYALVVNVVYGVVVAFSAYGVGHLFGSLVGTAIGLYFLYQIRPSYTKSAAAAKK